MNKNIEHGRLTGLYFYCCGPIDAVKSSDDFTQWRQEISEFLWSLGAGIMNPVNKPLSGVNETDEWRQKIKEWKTNKEYDKLSNEMKNVVTQDLHMLDLSSAIIAYIDTDVHMAGSYSEITYGCLERKQLVVFAKNGKKSIPNWIYGLGKHELFYNTLEEVKQYFLKVHRGEPTPHEDRWKFLDIAKIFGKDNHERNT